MNVIAMIILTAIVADFIIGRTADYLNLKVMQKDLPEAFQGVFDRDRYRQSQEYLRVNTRFGWVTSLFDALLLLLFWFGEGFPLLDQWVRSRYHGPVLSGLTYIGVLLLAKVILTFPFSLYHTFVIEERFGFNKTDVTTFVTDQLKGLGLAFLLGVPLLAGVLWFFEVAGTHAWWICWMVTTLYMLGVQFVAPSLIMPIFNKFTPLEEGLLKQAIMAYARSIQFPLENVFVMDGSRRSTKSNAFFTGFGRHKRIVLYDTLIENHSVKELVAVLAHEMGHYKKKHILQMLAVGIAQVGVIFFLLSLFISHQSLFDAFYMEEKSVYAGLVFFGLLFTPLDFFMGIMVRILSRKNEFEADRFAVETTSDPGAMADALKKLSVKNLSNLIPHPLYVFLNDAHPPVMMRLRAIFGGESR